MVIINYTSANQPFTSTGVNPNFAGAVVVDGSLTTTAETLTVTPPGSTQLFSVQPPAFTTTVRLTPPSVSVNGQLFPVPPIDQQLTLTPPPMQASVSVMPPPFQVVTPTKTASTSVRSKYECVGVVQGGPPKLVALVRPNVVCGAHHYSLSAGDKVTFYGATGLVTSTVKGVALTYDDLECYYLEDAVAGIQPAALMDQFGPRDYATRELMTYGLVGNRSGPYDWTAAAASMRIGRVTIGDNPNQTNVWTASCSSPSFFAYLEPGDSGAPNFFTYNGTIYYLGSTHNISNLFQVNVVSPAVAKINSL